MDVLDGLQPRRFFVVNCKGKFQKHGNGSRVATVTCTTCGAEQQLFIFCFIFPPPQRNRLENDFTLTPNPFSAVKLDGCIGRFASETIFECKLQWEISNTRKPLESGDGDMQDMQEITTQMYVCPPIPLPNAIVKSTANV